MTSCSCLANLPRSVLIFGNSRLHHFKSRSCSLSSFLCRPRLCSPSVWSPSPDCHCTLFEARTVFQDFTVRNSFLFDAITRRTEKWTSIGTLRSWFEAVDRSELARGFQPRKNDQSGSPAFPDHFITITPSYLGQYRRSYLNMA